MSDTNLAPAASADAIVSAPVSTPAPADNSPISLSEAARQLANWRNSRDKPDAQEEPAARERLAAAAPVEDLGEEPNVDPQNADPGEATEATPDPAPEPTIEPPRSWTAAEKAEFATYPREAQEVIARREQERDTATRRGQNEAAETRKALDAERAQVTEARTRYEQALPALLATLQEQQAGEFKDIKTMADVENMARLDYARYAAWDAGQKKLAAVHQEVEASKQRQAAEYEARWTEYSTKQDQLLIDRVPDLADKAKAQKLADGAAALYRDVGFDEKELASLWSGKSSISLRDARLSQIVIEAAKYREIRANAAKAPVKPTLPPVQRPGVSRPAQRDTDEVKALAKRFHETGSVRDAAALRLAQLRAK